MTGPSRRGRGRPVDTSSEETLAKVLDAALGQFGLYGFAGARMTEIAREAGVAHSVIYHYFPSKKALYAAAYDAAQAELLPAFLAALEGVTTLRGQITAFFRAATQASVQRPAITPFLASIPLELRRQPGFLHSLQSQGDTFVAALAKIFADARGRGEIPAETEDSDLVTAFVGAAMGIGLLAYGLPEGSMGRAVDIFLATLDGTFFIDQR